MHCGNEERVFWLALEKRLSEVHKQITEERRLVSDVASDELLQGLEAAQWHLGVAILQTARAAALPPIPVA
jgi:hypothetical protein